MLSNLRKRLPAILLSAMLLFAFGCGGAGSNRGNVKGTVKLDGKPVEQGSILFTPMDGTSGSVAGGEIINGQYQLASKSGPAIGWNRVEIRAMRKTGQMVQKAFAPPGEMIPEQVEAVPPKFNSDSELKFEIKPGDNTANFDLTST
jgi:hypothetical protein